MGFQTLCSGTYHNYRYLCHTPFLFFFQLVVDYLTLILKHILFFSSVQFSCSVVSDSATPWIAARQASLSITNSQSSLRLTSIESVMPSSHLILHRPLLLLPPIHPSIRVFSNESTLHMRWPKYWSFSFSIIPSKEGMVYFWWFIINYQKCVYETIYLWVNTHLLYSCFFPEYRV